MEDLIALPHLHEASILHSLCRRFDRGDIYTFTANAILLAVNPFKRLPLYSKELLTEYFNMGYMRQQGIEPPQALGPHVFAIADSAYRDMMKVHPRYGCCCCSCCLPRLLYCLSGWVATLDLRAQWLPDIFSRFFSFSELLPQ